MDLCPFPTPEQLLYRNSDSNEPCFTGIGISIFKLPNLVKIFLNENHTFPSLVFIVGVQINYTGFVLRSQICSTIRLAASLTNER